MNRQPPSIALRLIASAISLSLMAPPLVAQTAASRAAGHSPALKSGTQVTLNFVNAEIEAVTRAMGAMLDRQFIVDPRVKGNITVYSETPLTVREAYLNYLAALRGLGFTVVENAGLLKVVPEADAKLQAGTVSIGPVQQRGDQILTQIFRLNHENPNNLVAVLRPLISPNNTINANPGSNTLVITDYADNLARLGKIIAALDQPTASDIDVVPLKHGLASDMAPLVQRLADSGAGGVPGVPVASGGGVSVIADVRSNALIVRAANPARQSQVRAIIDKLDLPTQGMNGPGGAIWVVHLKNADAVKLAQVLRAAFGGGGSGGGSGSATSGAATSTSPAALSNAAATQGGASSQATAPIQASAGPSTGGFIQADPSTNSLIITAAEPLYRQVRSMIDKLDSRRAQVYIEALLVEVTGDNAADVGFQWQGLIGKDGNKNIGVIGTNLPNGNVPSIIDINTSAAAGAVAIGAGLNLGLIHDFGGKYALAAIAQFLQTQTNTNIMSTPNLITLDNEEAKIVVGSNVPFVTGQYTNTGSGTTSPFQTVERKDVGLTLRIKPQIGEGGTVRMTIFQEASDVIGQAAGTAGAGPTTSKRSIESNVVVDDGAILVLGGLIEDRYTDSKSKVPLLGDIPYIGGLFRSESRSKKRTNLMVFLRPVVMRTAEDANKISLDRYDMIRAQQQSGQAAPNVFLPVGQSTVLRPNPMSPPASASAPASAPAATLDAPPKTN
ncbi:MAG: type II secretion system secretin GspD [Pseudomonadota bacterium]